MLEQNIPIYDIRRPEKWQQTGVIEDSKLLTFVDGDSQLKPDFLNHFTAATGKLDPVILICRTGSRTSTPAGYPVEVMGYTQVFSTSRHHSLDQRRQAGYETLSCKSKTLTI